MNSTLAPEASPSPAPAIPKKKTPLNSPKSTPGVSRLPIWKRSNAVRTSWRTRTKKAIKKTAAEKRLARARNRKEREEYAEERQKARDWLQAHAEHLRTRFGKRTVEWYLEDMLQQRRMDKQRRRVNPWNAYLAQEGKRINSERAVQGLERLSLNDLVAQVKPVWQAMTPAKKEEATIEAIPSLKEVRDMKTTSMHNVAIHAFNDVRANVQAMEEASIALHARTRAIGFSLWVRSSDCALNAPYSYATCTKAEEFFNNVYGTSLSEISTKFEAFCLSGMEGIKKSNAKELLELKAKTRVIIESKLAEAAGVDKIRMVYATFGQQITAKYGLVIEHWPLPRFCCPSDVGSAMEVNLLYTAWKTETTKFRKLSAAELDAWFAVRAEAAATAAITTTPAPATTPTAVPAPSETAAIITANPATADPGAALLTQT
ncbi:hypothetical protein BOTBODRAFT_185150 [Botryobasidium botryosum FD-172 SS1]|uniref:Uncharacterized protein n=1 Tax=Botryobasidium botryosum (strain FD-172 SS1) TaxID=930990 RepID=A0A067MS79_BOTB1|nr:hypothetical protein BOTBODRAFT_185150 [Botryobasidium botryosum FD-172 SS1]